MSQDSTADLVDNDFAEDTASTCPEISFESFDDRQMWGDPADYEGDQEMDAAAIVFEDDNKKKHPSAKWSGDVTKKEKWHPPEGFFKKSSKDIAVGLKRESSSFKQAMSRLNFYINRAGKDLSEKDKKRLEQAKVELRKLYGVDKKAKKPKKKE